MQHREFVAYGSPVVIGYARSRSDSSGSIDTKLEPTFDWRELLNYTRELRDCVRRDCGLAACEAELRVNCERLPGFVDPDLRRISRGYVECLKIEGCSLEGPKVAE